MHTCTDRTVRPIFVLCGSKDMFSRHLRPFWGANKKIDFWSEWCSDLSRAVDRLCLVGAQDALILLCALFSAPRVQHLLRCSPSVDVCGPQTFDDLLKSALSRFTNNTLCDSQWLQASLPIKFGGLGIGQVTSLALPPFWLRRRVLFCYWTVVSSRCLTSWWSR